jgi:alcohol dehydrogenase class IV
MKFTDTYSATNVKKLVSGVNSIDNLNNIVKEFNTDTVLIVTDMGFWNTGLVEKPKSILEKSDIKVDIINDVPAEPELEQVIRIFDRIKDKKYGMLIGMGGGSVMDVTKLLSVMMTNDMHIEGMIGVEKIPQKGVTTLMIPTTAGTGSEATPNAIVSIPEQELKVGIVSKWLVPDYVILDPVMTLKLPPSVTASTGMDALTHALECYISKKANPMSDIFALKAINLICGGIEKVYAKGDDLEARHDMLLGSYLGGMCIASSSTAAVHALAYPLGGKFKIPHGISNAMLLHHVMEFNRDAIEERLKDVAVQMGIDTTAISAQEAAGKVIERLKELSGILNIPSSLKTFGVTEGDLNQMVEAASKVTRLLDNNPKRMSLEDIENIYKKLL